MNDDHRHAPDRIGILGGSFDPPHLGHEHIAKQAASDFDLDRLLIIPAGQSPLKQGHESGAGQRYAMARIMVDSISREFDEAGLDCIIDLRRDEINRQGRSYTYLTLKSLAEEFPDDHLYLVIGDDNLKNFTSWKRWREVLDIASLVVAPRLKSDPRETVPNELAEYADSVHFIESPILPVSSTELRRRLVSGESIEGYINPDVYEYIRANSIYMV